MCDLVGSTTRHARLGEDAADEFRTRFFGAMTEVVERHAGEVVKNLGDGLLVVFRRSTVAALDCAHDLHLAIESIDPLDPLELRVGVSAGEAAEENADWFGMPVIEASRLCSAAAPATTVTTDVVRNIVGSRGGHNFGPLGPRELKGIPQRVLLFTVTSGSTERDGPTPGATSTAGKGGRTRAMRVATALIGVLAIVAITVLIASNRGASRSGSTPPQTTSGSGTTPTSTSAPTSTIVAATISPTSTPTIVVATPSTPESTATPTTVAQVPARVAAPVGYMPTLVPRSCDGDVVAGKMTGVECWTLTVPEDRRNPARRSLDLSVYRVPARTNPATAPSVIDLGPANPLDDNPITQVANVVAIPSRGFGLSSPALDCPEMYAAYLAALGRPSADPTSADEELAAVRTCHDRLTDEGVSLSSYNMDAEVSDVTD